MPRLIDWGFPINLIKLTLYRLMTDQDVSLLSPRTNLMIVFTTFTAYSRRSTCIYFHPFTVNLDLLPRFCDAPCENEDGNQYDTVTPSSSSSISSSFCYRFDNHGHKIYFAACSLTHIMPPFNNHQGMHGMTEAHN